MQARPAGVTVAAWPVVLVGSVVEGARKLDLEKACDEGEHADNRERDAFSIVIATNNNLLHGAREISQSAYQVI
jgi:hypothetical protein